MAKKNLPRKKDPSKRKNRVDAKLTRREEHHSEYRKSEIYHSNIPHYEQLEQYEILAPGFSEKFLNNIASQTPHRQKLEEIKIKGDLEAQRRGQLFAFLLVVAGLTATTVVGVWGNPWSATAIAGLSFGSVTTAFLTSHKSQKEDLAKKATEQGKQVEQKQ